MSEGLEFHPVADIFPMMSDRELAELTTDIAEHGLREPIWLHSDGRIIDGRNRWLACERAGLPPVFREYSEEESKLVTFVVSLNLHRRHLDTSQRAMVGARIEDFERGRPSKDVNSHLKRSDAAAVVNVSEWSIAQAKKVQESGVPELAEQVESGRVAVSTAATIADAPDDEQRAVIAIDDEKEIIRRANEIKRRKTEARRAEKEQERRTARQAGSNAGDPEIRTGDFRKALDHLQDASVDLILTDPPYGEDAVRSYAALAEFAARKLKPGGSLICYAGQSTLNKVLRAMDRHLRYWWTCSLTHNHGSQQLPGKWVMVEWKPVVWYVRDHRAGKEYVADRISGSKPDKDAHEWAQGIDEVFYLIEQLTNPGDLVVDPFAGSGSFGRAALSLNRRFIGADLDPDSARGEVVA